MKHPNGAWTALRQFTDLPSADIARDCQLPCSRMVSSRIIIGRHEWITLPDFSTTPWIAKTDSGARTSTLHATDVTLSSDQQTAHFHTIASDGSPLECAAPVLRHKLIRNSAGMTELRVIISTTAIFFGGLSFPIQLTLADRSHMKCPVLLGRRAMAGYFLIDPQSDFLLGKHSFNSTP